MQEISDILNNHLAQCFSWMDCLEGFARDIEYSKKNNEKWVVPFGCNQNPDECDNSELEYLLPESTKQAKVFYDQLKTASGSVQLECNNTEFNYTFDMVVWVNTNKVHFNQTQFCTDAEALYNHILSCLYDVSELDIVNIDLYKDYKRNPWKFDQKCIKFLNPPYIAFRIPIAIKYVVCDKDLDPLNVEIKEC